MYYAMKVIRKERLLAKETTLQHALEERKVLERLRGNPFLVELKYAWQSDARIHIVMGESFYENFLLLIKYFQSIFLVREQRHCM